MSYFGWLTDKFGNKYGTETNPLQVGFGDSASLDAFARLRTANPVNLFENKNIHGRQTSQWEEPIVGAIIVHGAVTGGPFQVAETITGGTSGAIGTVSAVDAGSLTVTYSINHNDIVDGETITGGTSGATAAVTTHNTGSNVSHDRDTASVILQVGENTADSAIRQTHRYFSYVPGKSHEVWETFYFGPTDAPVLVHRTKTSGAVVDDEIAQAVWNIDNFDGDGDAENPSGVKIDWSKSQFLVIDLQWQGDGRVRVGFFHNGRILYAHAFNFSDTVTSVYMSTPSLPARHEITNVDGTNIDRKSGYFDAENGIFIKQRSDDASRTMRELCTAIVSLGGERPSGLGFSKSNDVTARTINNAGGLVPIFAIRLKAVHPNGSDNRVTCEFSNMTFYPLGNAAHFELKHVHEPSSVTATWADVGGGSACEYSADISAITAPIEHVIDEGYAGAGAAGKGGSETGAKSDKLDQHRFMTQNFDSTNSELFIIYGQALTGNGTAYAHISWIEFD